jgi:outer membrane protein OmpA-like peptidoglycan-associated protein
MVRQANLWVGGTMKAVLFAIALAVAAASPSVAQQGQQRIVITFAADSDELPDAAVAQLRQFARAHPDEEITVEGHATIAESEGNSEAYARGLSHRRANSLADVIYRDDVERRGYTKDRQVTRVAWAADRPLKGVAASDARNRRAELYLGGRADGW